MIDENRLKFIPMEQRKKHEFCFWLHDLMLDVMRQAENARIADVRFSFKDEQDKKAFEAAADPIIYALENDRVDLARRIVLNQTVIPLVSDALHFICEALFTLERRKHTVSMALLRKPLRQNLLLLTWMLADGHDFFVRMRDDVTELDRTSSEEKIALLNKAISTFKYKEPFDGDLLYEMIFDKKNQRALGPYFDQALHLVTNHAAIRTENLNLNMIFAKPSDDGLYDGLYDILAYAFLYMLFLEIETIGRMGKVPDYYLQWLMIATIGVWESIFSESTKMLDEVHKIWAEVLSCTLCQKPLTIRREDALEFFSFETLRCQHCKAEQQFPMYWLMSKVQTPEPTPSLRPHRQPVR